MTHGSVPVEMKDMMGLTEDLIRLSVGIENLEDIYADISEAL
jgi:cystathionine beta-lyase/cystathionine gamma-synthase